MRFTSSAPHLLQAGEEIKWLVDFLAATTNRMVGG
jgi:hypothetical protein